MPLSKKGPKIMSSGYGPKKSIDHNFYGHLNPEKKHIIVSTDGTKPIGSAYIQTDKQGTYC